MLAKKVLNWFGPGQFWVWQKRFETIFQTGIFQKAYVTKKAAKAWERQTLNERLTLLGKKVSQIIHGQIFEVAHKILVP